jgi:flap endonuclease-1
MLKEMGFTQTEFVDLCILCGCDYTKSIGGMGPGTCFKMIKERGTIERVLEYVKTGNANRKKPFVVPDPFLYKESRELFKNPDVNSNADDINS